MHLVLYFILGVASQQILSTGDSNTKPDKQDTTTVKVVGAPSLECTEPSSVLQAPIPIIPKQSPAQVVSSQVRTRPLQTLLPAPPKPVIVTAATTLSSNTVVRKLPQILPAPAKTTVMLPVAKANQPLITTSAITSLGSTSSLGTTASLSNTALLGSTGKVPLVHFVAKSTQPTMVSKLCVSKTVPVVSTQVSPAPGTLLAQPGQQMAIASKSAGALQIGSTQDVKQHSSLEAEGHCEKDKSKTESCSSDVTSGNKEDNDDTKTDNNTSSEDDSLLVCSETIDSGAGLHEVSPQEEIPEATPDEVLAMSTPLKQSQHLNVTDNKEEGNFEALPSVAVTKTPPPLPENPKVVVEVLDALDTKPKQLNAKDKIEEDETKNENNQDMLFENSTNLEEHKDFDKTGNGQDYDAVNSFLEIFSHDQVKDRGETTTNDSCVDEMNTKGDNDTKDEKTKINTNTEKQSLHSTDENMKTTLPDLSAGSSSILSAFDFLDTGKNNVDTKSTSELQPSNVVQKDTNMIPQDLSENTSTGSGLNVQSLKEFAQKTIEESNSNSCTHIPQNTNILENNSSQMSNTISTSLSLSNNEALATSSSGGQELSESEKLALEAIANVRTSSRKRKPPTVLTLSPPRQTSGWVRGALRYSTYFLPACVHPFPPHPPSRKNPPRFFPLEGEGWEPMYRG